MATFNLLKTYYEDFENIYPNRNEVKILFAAVYQREKDRFISEFEN